MYERFGSAFRTRVSEINCSPSSAVQILNNVSIGKDKSGEPCELSVYWSELRPTVHPAKELIESDYMRRVRQEEAQAMPLFAEEHQ